MAGSELAEGGGGDAGVRLAGVSAPPARFDRLPRSRRRTYATRDENKNGSYRFLIIVFEILPTFKAKLN